MSTSEPKQAAYYYGDNGYYHDNNGYGSPYAQPVPAKKQGPGYIGTVRTDALTDIFNEFASEALRKFPKLRGNFLVTDGKTGEAIGDVSPGKLSVAAEDLAFELAQQIYSEEKGGYADTVMLDPNRSDIVNEGEIYSIRFNKHVPLSGDATKDIKFTLRHELGHAVVPGGLAVGDPSKANFAEKSGDLLGMMMHIQEYGDDHNDYLTLVARMRSETILQNFLGGFPEIAHFTNQALSLFVARKDSLDVKNMTPDQMTATAADIASQTELTPEKRRALTKIIRRSIRGFAYSVQQTGNKDFSNYLRSVVVELLSDKVTKAEFEMGLEIIKPFMKNVPGHPSKLPFDGGQLIKIQDALIEKSRTVQDPPKNFKPQTGLQKSFSHVEHLAKSRQPQPQYGGGMSLEDLLGSLFGKQQPQPKRQQYGF